MCDLRIACLLAVLLVNNVYGYKKGCKTTRRGQEYRGTLSITRNGRTCQRWDRQYPHRHNRYRMLPLPINSHANYCRNPDNSPHGPWCYTTNPTSRWEYCKVPYCAGTRPLRVECNCCKITKLGREYSGNLARTISGRTCQHWSRLYPHKHTKYLYSIFGYDLSKNYCRNPDKEPYGPWCYTTDPRKRWEYCNVPMCDCKKSRLGKEYRGHLAVTRSGIPCRHWSRTRARHLLPWPVRAHANYCRNPTNSSRGPWCFTSWHRWEYCDIRMCPRYFLRM